MCNYYQWSTSGSLEMTTETAYYRITGKQAKSRISPLLQHLQLSSKIKWLSVEAESVIGSCDNTQQKDSLVFVWETHCEKSWKIYHEKTLIYNRLHNVNILESKSNLAYLLYKIKEKPFVLETFIAVNKVEIMQWCHRKWIVNDTMLTEHSITNASFLDNNNKQFDIDWWVIKASNGNGGRDIWIVNKNNYKQVIDNIPSVAAAVGGTIASSSLSKQQYKHDEYVVQRYVSSPMLYNNKKCHFRCYATMSATMAASVYCDAFLLPATHDYRTNTINTKNDDNNINDPLKQKENDEYDNCRFITNLSVNKANASHPGQLKKHLPTEYPQIFEQLKSMWSEVVGAASAFMRYQRSVHHYEFFGLDIMADEAGVCYLIEVNRLPGLESAGGNPREQDELFDPMMTELLQRVTAPLFAPRQQQSSASNTTPTVVAANMSNITASAPIITASHSFTSAAAAEGWIDVLSPPPLNADSCSSNTNFDAVVFSNISIDSSYNSGTGTGTGIDSKTAATEQNYTSNSPMFKNMFLWKAHVNKHKSALRLA